MFLFQASSQKNQQSQPPVSQKVRELEQMLLDQHTNGTFNSPAAIKARMDAAVGIYNSIVQISDFGALKNPVPTLIPKTPANYQALALCKSVMSEVQPKAETASKALKTIDHTPMMVGMQYAIASMVDRAADSEIALFNKTLAHYENYSSVLDHGYATMPSGKKAFVLGQGTINELTRLLDATAGTSAKSSWLNIRCSNDAEASRVIEALNSMPLMNFSETPPEQYDASYWNLKGKMVSVSFYYDESGKKAPVSYRVPENFEVAATAKDRPKQEIGREFTRSKKRDEQYTPAEDIQSFLKRITPQSQIVQDSFQKGAQDVTQSAVTQLAYAARSLRKKEGKTIKVTFDPKNPESVRLARDLVLQELRTMALDMGYSGAQDQRNFAGFLSTDKGLEFLKKIKEKKLIITGSATLEEKTDAALNANKQLASDRAQMLEGALTSIITDAVKSKYADGWKSQISGYLPVKIDYRTSVASIWDDAALRTGTFTYLKNVASGKQKIEGTEEEQANAQRYAEYLWSRFSTALNDKFEITNTKLMTSLLRRTKLDPTRSGKAASWDIGLRFEGDRSEAKTDQEKAGAFLVSVMERRWEVSNGIASATGFTRSGGIQRDVKGELGLHMEPAKVDKEGRATVRFEVDYKIDKSSCDFLPSENGKLRVYYASSQANEWDVKNPTQIKDGLAYTDNVARIGFDEKTGKTVYEATFQVPAGQKQVLAYAIAEKGQLSSGYVGQVVEGEIPKPKKKSLKDIPLVPTIAQLPLFVLYGGQVASSVAGSIGLTAGIKDAYKSELGIDISSLDPNSIKNGVTLPSGSSLLNFRSKMSTTVDNWLGLKLDNGPDGDWQGPETSVAQWVQNNIDTSRGKTYEQFVAAMKTGDWNTAIDCLKEKQDPSIGSPTLRSGLSSIFKVEKSKLMLDRAALAEYVLRSFHQSAGVNFNLNESGSSVLQVYLQHDGYILVTNNLQTGEHDRMDILTTGARWLAEVDLGELWGALKWAPMQETTLGAGVQYETSSPLFSNEGKLYYLEVGLKSRINLSDAIEVALGTTIRPFFGKDIDPSWTGEYKLEPTIKFSKVVSMKVGLSYLITPEGLSYLGKNEGGSFWQKVGGNTMASVGIDYKLADNVAINAGMFAYTLYTKNKDAKIPLGFNVSVRMGL